MIIFKKNIDIQHFIQKKREEGKKIGFVPTMGALHEGHLSLIKQSINENEVTVCSIFINPTQFNNLEDFEKYPITINQDLDQLEDSGCNVVFLPTTAEIYPDNFIKKHYELGVIENVLEGAFRSGHYQGVCLVVERLLSLIPAHTLYLGQKDFQQCLVIKKMIELLQLKINVKVCNTVREPNGLAMSSRNQRLSEMEKEKAGFIYKTLKYIQEHSRALPIEILKKNGLQILSEITTEIDYLEITDFNLEPIKTIEKNKEGVILVAAHINGVRLIDNLMLSK